MEEDAGGILSVTRIGRTTSLVGSNRGLDKLPFDLLKNAVTEIDSVEDLDLSDNNLSTINDELDSLCENLQILDLSFNAFQQLPTFICNLCFHLKVLSIQNNQISKIPNEIKNLKHLEELYFSNNKLTEIPDIQELNYLSIIDLSHNQIKKIQIDNLQKENNVMEEIYLTNNKIEEIPDCFGNYKNLLILDFSHNLISTIPNSLSYLREIREIRLQNNKISKIPVDFVQLTSLKFLDVSSNVMVFPPNIVCKQGWNSIMKYLELQVSKNTDSNNSLTINDKKPRRLSRQTAFS